MSYTAENDHWMIECMDLVASIDDIPTSQLNILPLTDEVEQFWYSWAEDLIGDYEFELALMLTDAEPVCKALLAFLEKEYQKYFNDMMNRMIEGDLFDEGPVY